ncbi:hypothetical protein [Porphyromonas sp. COT-239 OH1446]|uniref:hypothetical protein n=1 Tax=Porphyromonas sp. COT-239 OH1446 TaxID=1515613 RepID=UPI00052C88C6|nr:hypothetical protein [Porphyromonas sp. COT-239 OH1446]KGN68088.1 hypothetical protein HQ37_06920 [Porphyromonas sp. COT-239 OH1446]
MKINVKTTNRILLILGVVIVVAAAISCIWLNDAQRMVVGIGAFFAVLNLLFLSYFFNKNVRRRR